MIFILRASALLKRLLRVSISNFFFTIEVGGSQHQELRSGDLRRRQTSCRRGQGGRRARDALIELDKRNHGNGRLTPCREERAWVMRTDRV